jgi:penicillin-insensitive murein endopeptidase
LVLVAKNVAARALSSALPRHQESEPPRVSLDALTRSEILARLSSDPGSLGPISIGGPSRGALFNGEQVQESPLWHVVEPEHSWGAPEAIASIESAIERVSAEYPDSPPLYVGHLSSRNGGYLRPHRSHQSGRDVDLGYYYVGGPGWYARATAKNLDRVRTWALVKALASDANVEAIFMDRSVQQLLREQALASGESPVWLEALFEGPRRGGDHLIVHEWGHLTHLHVRFKCKAAQHAGERTHEELVASRQIPARRYY